MLTPTYRKTPTVFEGEINFEFLETRLTMRRAYCLKGTVHGKKEKV